MKDLVLIVPRETLQGCRPVWFYFNELGNFNTSDPPKLKWLDENNFPYVLSWEYESYTNLVYYFLEIDDPEVELVFRLRWKGI